MLYLTDPHEMMSNLKVKVTDLEKNYVKFIVKVFKGKADSGELLCPVSGPYI